MKTIAKELIKLLKHYNESGYISYNDYIKLYPDNYALPHIYALIKIHKENNPARIICPYYTHPLYNLSKFIIDIITPSIRCSPYSICDRSLFINDIKNIRITRNDMMISLDIVNLFTNIPLDMTLNIIQEKLYNDDDLGNRTDLPISEIMSLIEYIMNNNFFKFRDKTYLQKSGAPMGCNLSPILAEALVSTIFEIAIKDDKNVKFCRFFVDDSFLIINHRYVEKFLNKINEIGKIYKSISFTIEKEQNYSLAFLDIKLTRLSNRLETSVFRKNTHSHRYLNFYSHSSIQNKLGVINNLVNRSLKFSSNKEYLDSDLSIIKNGLISNNYPPKFIDKNIQKCIAKFEYQRTIEPEVFDSNKIVVIPYFKKYSEEISAILRKQGIKCVYKRGKTISNLLNCNEKQSDLDKNNVVYTIPCKDCSYVYTGQTKRKLRSRILEHKRALNYPYLNSNVADHAIDNFHDIDFDSTKINYNEKNYRARIFLESVEIEKNKHAKIPIMNDQQNSRCLIPNVYLPLFNK